MSRCSQTAARFLAYDWVALGRPGRLALLACGLVGMALTGGLEAQMVIDKRVTILPIYVRDNAGSNQANPSQILYEAETDKIWSQAGIDVQFLPGIFYDNSLFLDLSSSIAASDSLFQLRQTSGQPWSTSIYGGTTYADTVVRLFFVQTIDGSTSNLGFTLQSDVNPDINSNPNPTQENFMAIANNAFTLNRRDIIAHELGHALALNHTGFGQSATGNLNLMTDGGTRTSPTFIGNIYPDGTGTSRLAGAVTVGNPDYMTEQIDRARVMPIAVNITPFIYNPIPEPGTTAAAVGAIVMVAAVIWRRRRLGET